MTLALLIAACVAILADAYLTRLGLRVGLGEDNDVRMRHIDTLGEDVGTWGVALAACAALVASYLAASESPVAGISYAMTFCAFTYVSFNNYRRIVDR